MTGLPGKADDQSQGSSPAPLSRRKKKKEERLTLNVILIARRELTVARL
jgi:hypothetical protein